MAADYFKMGYSAYVDGSINEVQVRQQHPTFRVGWNSARKIAESKNELVSEVKVQKVSHEGETAYELQYKDLQTVMSFHPWNRLNKRELEPLKTAVVRSVEARKGEITRFGQVIDMVRQYWELILQHGFDEGILTRKDLRQYDFEPKVKKVKTNVPEAN